MTGEEHGTARARVTVHGRVQGVWFRAGTSALARRLGLSGWVRNLPAGGVEAVFEGPRDRVEKALVWCRQGPEDARVERCDVVWAEPMGEPAPFTVRYD